MVQPYAGSNVVAQSPLFDMGSLSKTFPIGSKDWVTGDLRGITQSQETRKPPKLGHIDGTQLSVPLNVLDHLIDQKAVMASVVTPDENTGPIPLEFEGSSFYSGSESGGLWIGGFTDTVVKEVVWVFLLIPAVLLGPGHTGVRHHMTVPPTLEERPKKLHKRVSFVMRKWHGIRHAIAELDPPLFDTDEDVHGFFTGGSSLTENSSKGTGAPATYTEPSEHTHVFGYASLGVEVWFQTRIKIPSALIASCNLSELLPL
jgi:hypothetical protein